MNQQKSELHEAMKRQGITYTSLAHDSHHSRQKWSRAAKEYMHGGNPEPKDICDKFDLIMANDRLIRDYRGEMTASEEIENHLNVNKLAIEKILAEIRSLTGDDSKPEFGILRLLSEDWIKKIQNLADEKDRKTIDKLLIELQERIIFKKAYESTEKEMKEAEDYNTIWDKTPDSKGRAKENYDEYIHSFGMINGNTCRIEAEVYDYYLDVDAQLEITAELFVLTDKGLWVVDSQPCKLIGGSEVYGASFNNLIPGYKYFYMVWYEHTVCME